MRPRELPDVDQAVHAVQVDERAEVDDVRHLSLHHVARLQLIEDLLALILALLLQHRAAREDDVVAGAVELDHLCTEFLAEELVEVLHTANVDQRRRQEAAHAEVEDQTTLDDLDHAAVDRFPGFGGALDVFQASSNRARFFERIRRPSASSFVSTSASTAVAERHFVGRVDRPPDRELGDGDDPLRLVADVDQHLVLVHPDDGAVHDLPLVDPRERSSRSRE